MKPNFKLRSLLAGSTLLALSSAVQADVLYWDTNGTSAGFGASSATWSSAGTSRWNQDPLGGSANGGFKPTDYVTATTDFANFGTDTLAHAAGALRTITVSGAVEIGSITMGAANTSESANTQIQFTGGSINLADIATITNNATSTAKSATLTFLSEISGAATSLTFTTQNITGPSSINSTGLHSYTGATIISANSLLRASNIADGGTNSALGASSADASNLVLNEGAAFRFDGAAGEHSTDRNFTINGSTATIYNRGNGNLTWNGTAAFGTPDQAATLKLQTSNATTTGNIIFGGILADNGTGQLSLVKFGSSKADAGLTTLSSANTFTGSTAITGGILVLGHANALQNSYIDTAVTATGTSTAGLRTSGTALNLGGLSGDKDLSAIYTTSTGGYDSVTDITLNVAAANNLSYDGVIDGSRSLTKAGAGTQTLTGTQDYTGATTITGGTLDLGASGSIASSASVTIGAGATLDTSAQASYAIPTGQPVEFAIDGAGAGSSGKISADALDISDATVTYNIAGPLNDAAYVLATYTAGQLTGTFLSAPADPAGYQLQYAYQGNKIALVSTGTNDFDSWAASQVPPITGGENGDDDNDGVANLVEYALVDGGERGTLSGNTITFTKRGGVYGSDITYIIETSETLASGSWTAEVTHGPGLLVSNPTISYTFTPSTPVKKFARLKITRP